MNVYILFGQRMEDYPEQHAPEALEIMDEYAYDENGQWLETKRKEYEASKTFYAVKIVRVDLGAKSQEHIRELLVGTPKIKGAVKGTV